MPSDQCGEKIKNTLDLWKMRRLTFYGKVTIIKHLVTSQLVYTGTAVPVPLKIIKLVNRLVYSFLWNSKREKVKRTVCYNSETEGGLKMVDLLSKCLSLRLSWIDKYLIGEQTSWKILFKYWTKKIGDMPMCLKFNCNKKDILSICKRKKLPVFYIDLFCSWSELRYTDMFNVSDVKNEIIWYNSNIKYGNEMLYFQSWMKEGIFTVEQVIEGGKWKDIKCISDVFRGKQLLASFKLSKLKKAFPNFWLEKLRNSTRTTVRPQTKESMIGLATGDSINVLKMTAKHYYRLFLNKNKREPSCIYLWQDQLELPNDFNWNNVLKYKFYQINDNKIKQFNFKLFHRILPSRDNLCKWGILNDNLCHICNCKETITHFLLTCKKIKMYWKVVSCLIRNIFDLEIDINEKVIILGHDIGNRKMKLINLILNYAQFIIYRNYVKDRNKRNNHLLNVNYLLKDLKAEIRFYFNQLKYNQKRYEETELEIIRSYFS